MESASSPTPVHEEKMLKGLAGSRYMRRTMSRSKISAMITEMFGNADELRRRYRADSGDINAALSPANSLSCTGDFGETLPILHALVGRGIPQSGDQLAAKAYSSAAPSAEGVPPASLLPRDGQPE